MLGPAYGLWRRGLIVNSLHHIHRFPVATEVPGQAVAQLEADSEPSILKEDVSVPQLRQVEAYPLALLRQGSLDAPDQAGVLQGVYAPVAGGDWNRVFPAELDCRPGSLEGSDEYLR